MQMENNVPQQQVCKCTHSKKDHVRTIVLSGPGNPKSVPVGEIYRCMQCLCQDFEPKEQAVEEKE